MTFGTAWESDDYDDQEGWENDTTEDEDGEE